MSRKIRKVAVLGSGVMGSGIACHLANVGIEVLLLDIVPFDISEADKTKPAARPNVLAQEDRGADRSDQRFERHEHGGIAGLPALHTRHLQPRCEYKDDHAHQRREQQITTPRCLAW